MCFLRPGPCLDLPMCCGVALLRSCGGRSAALYFPQAMGPEGGIGSGVPCVWWLSRQTVACTGLDLRLDPLLKHSRIILAQADRFLRGPRLPLTDDTFGSPRVL
jgi:hypothetical protein